MYGEVDTDRHGDGDTVGESEIERLKIAKQKTSASRGAQCVSASICDCLTHMIAQTLPNPLSNFASLPSHISTRKTTTRHPTFMPMPTLSTHSQSNSHLQPMPLHILLPTLPSIHIAFFSYLDKQLEKIDKFYSQREKEAQARSKALEIQLRELKDHRRLFYVIKLSYILCFQFQKACSDSACCPHRKRIRTLVSLGQRH
jgi:hypothetical protein